MSDFDEFDPPEDFSEPEAVTVVDGLPPAVALVDYRGASPLALCPAKDSEPVVLTPGLNKLPADQWEQLAGHPGVLARLPHEPRDEDDEPGPLAGTLLVLDRVPRRGAELFGLIERTWSMAGLAAIEEAERAIYGDKPRGVVVSALAEARRLLEKRGMA